MKSFITKNLPNFVAFLLNSIITYYALFLMLFSLSSVSKTYIYYTISILISHIFFTIFPIYKRSKWLIILLKSGLHTLLSYILLVLFSNI